MLLFIFFYLLLQDLSLINNKKMLKYILFIYIYLSIYFVSFVYSVLLFIYYYLLSLLLYYILIVYNNFIILYLLILILC